MSDIANGWVWVGFTIFLLMALCVDTFLSKGYSRSRSSLRTAFIWTCAWISSALIFNVLLWCYAYLTVDIAYANEKALDFLSGYLIEKSLSIDNMFAFYIIFQYFNIPPHLQPRVFSYGIWSAVVLRLLLILAGVALVTHFHWLLSLMGLFLLLTGIKMFFVKPKENELSESWLLAVIKKVIRFTPTFSGQQFFVKKNKLLYATPLFVALIFIEFSDVIFAFDSIPAILAITRDPFIVWTSNIFAILGLRALYFILAGMADRFHLLKYGIALILVFVGGKMLAEPWLNIPILISLCVIIGIIVSFAAMSLIERQSQGR